MLLMAKMQRHLPLYPLGPVWQRFCPQDPLYLPYIFHVGSQFVQLKKSLVCRNDNPRSDGVPVGDTSKLAFLMSSRIAIVFRSRFLTVTPFRFTQFCSRSSGIHQTLTFKETRGPALLSLLIRGGGCDISSQFGRLGAVGLSRTSTSFLSFFLFLLSLWVAWFALVTTEVLSSLRFCFE